MASNLRKIFVPEWLRRTFRIENSGEIAVFFDGEWFRAAYSAQRRWRPPRDCIIHCRECTTVWSLSRQGKYECTRSGKFSWCSSTFVLNKGHELVRSFTISTQIDKVFEYDNSLSSYNGISSMFNYLWLIVLAVRMGVQSLCALGVWNGWVPYPHTNLWQSNVEFNVSLYIRRFQTYSVIIKLTLS